MAHVLDDQQVRRQVRYSTRLLFMHMLIWYPQRRELIGTPLCDLAYVTAFGGVNVRALRVCFASKSLQSSVTALQVYNDRY